MSATNPFRSGGGLAGAALRLLFKVGVRGWLRHYRQLREGVGRHTSASGVDGRGCPDWLCRLNWWLPNISVRLIERPFFPWLLWQQGSEEAVGGEVDMSKTPNLDTLRELNGRLTNLLDDAHPGLATWSAALLETLGAMAEFTAYPSTMRDLLAAAHNAQLFIADHLAGDRHSQLYFAAMKVLSQIEDAAPEGRLA